MNLPFRTTRMRYFLARCCPELDHQEDCRNRWAKDFREHFRFHLSCRKGMQIARRECSRSDEKSLAPPHAFNYVGRWLCMSETDRPDTNFGGECISKIGRV